MNKRLLVALMLVGLVALTGCAKTEVETPVVEGEEVMVDDMMMMEEDTMMESTDDMMMEEDTMMESTDDMMMEEDTMMEEEMTEANS